jgi:hypothetical protein
MRTTIDLPEDLHRVALSIARDSRQTLSQTVATLMRQALNAPDTEPGTGERQGFPLLRTRRALTAEDVRALDDEG